jgi:hypothetical protein
MTGWLVESYWPAALGSPRQVAARLRAVALGSGLSLVGVVHVPEDEMALWRIEAAAADDVRSAMDAAGVTFERIVAVVDLPSAATAGPSRMGGERTRQG